MNRPDDMLDYTYTHSQTQATTGYFSCEPPASLTWEAALARLEAAPLDDFLHQHCLRQAAKKGLESLKQLARDCYDAEADAFRRPATASLVLECALLLPELAGAADVFPADAPERLAPSTPLIYLRAGVPTLISQIRKRGREYEMNIDEAYLRRLNDKYNHWIDTIYEGEVLVVDKDREDFVSDPAVLEKICAHIDALRAKRNDAAR